jgi:hypothetical protein
MMQLAVAALGNCAAEAVIAKCLKLLQRHDRLQYRKPRGRRGGGELFRVPGGGRVPPQGGRGLEGRRRPSHARLRHEPRENERGAETRFVRSLRNPWG